MDFEQMRLMKVSGAHRRPIMKDREKFRVARVERKRPRRRSEKDLMRRKCWDVGAERVRRAARRSGRKTLDIMLVIVAGVKYLVFLLAGWILSSYMGACLPRGRGC